MPDTMPQAPDPLVPLQDASQRAAPTEGALIHGVSRSWLRRRGTAKWGYDDPAVIGASAAEMDFTTAGPVLAAITDAVEREELGYANPALAREVAEAAATWHGGAYGWSVPPTTVHVLPDVLRGVELAIEFFTPPGSPVLLLTPAYPPFFEIPRMLGRPIIEVPLAVGEAGDALELAAVESAFRRGAGTLVLCHPHNPVGRSFGRRELQELSVLAAKHGVRVVSDEVHAPLTYTGRHVPYASVSDESAAHTVTVTSASKAWNIAGLKCAQLITSNPADEKVWQRIPSRRTKGASVLGMRATVAAFREGDPWRRHAVSYLDGNRKALVGLLRSHLPDVGYRVPDATYFAWLDCDALDVSDDPAAFFLDQARVATSPGASFGPRSAGFIRLNFATPRPILEDAVIAMGAATLAR